MKKTETKKTALELAVDILVCEARLHEAVKAAQTRTTDKAK